MTTVSVPSDGWVQDLGPAPDGVRLVPWDLEDPPPTADIEVVVPPYLGDRSRLSRLAELPGLRLVQTLTAGYEDVLPYLPDGVALANAAGVHDASTAELAVALALASLRRLPEHVRSQAAGQWRPAFGRSLADRRVLLLGYGGVGRAVARRLAGFEVEVTPVASRARDGVHGDRRAAAAARRPRRRGAHRPADRRHPRDGRRAVPGRAARRCPPGQRRAGRGRGLRRAARRAEDRPAHGGGRRDRPRAAAARAPPVGAAGAADDAARGRGVIGLPPARARPAAPRDRRPGQGGAARERRGPRGPAPPPSPRPGGAA